MKKTMIRRNSSRAVFLAIALLFKVCRLIQVIHSHNLTKDIADRMAKLIVCRAMQGFHAPSETVQNKLNISCRFVLCTALRGYLSHVMYTHLTCMHQTNIKMRLSSTPKNSVSALINNVELGNLAPSRKCTPKQ